MKFYIAEILALFAWILLIVSFWKNKDNKLLFIQIIANILFLLNYIFLHAYTGLFIVIFEAIRDYIYIKIKDDRKVFFLTLPVYLVIGLFSFNGIISLVSILASINDGYSLIYHGKRVVLLGIITYALWLIYDMYYLNYVNVFAEGIIIISNILILHKQKNKLFIFRRCGF